MNGPSVRRSAWLVAAIVTLVAFHWWTYGDFVHRFFAFDDFEVLNTVERAHVESPADAFRLLAPTQGFALYRPLTTGVYFAVQHAVWGLNPVGWMSTHLALHVLNGLLAYAIAGRLLGSRPAGLAAALIYASAPGHTLAARWLSFCTITGTALVYFAGLWVWLRMRSPWRAPVALGVLIVGLGCSEHALTFPLALTLVAVLVEGRRDGWRLARELAPLYAVTAAYAVARITYLYVVLPRRAPLEAMAYRASYGLSFAPVVALQTLGRYVTGAVSVALPLELADRGCAVLGGAALALALVASIAALRRDAGARLRATAFGLDAFVVALAPVVLLPQHVYLAYVGIPALGTALAVAAVASMLPGRAAAALLVAAALAVVDVRTASPLAREQQDFRLIDATATAAVRWLTTIQRRAAAEPSVRDVVVPSDPITRRLFGSAHRMFLCARYDVRPVDHVEAEPEAPGRLRLAAPDPLRRGERADWSPLVRSCPPDPAAIPAETPEVSRPR